MQLRAADSGDPAGASLRARDAETGRAWRYVITASVIVAAIVVSTFQVLSYADGRIEREVARGGFAKTTDLELRNADVAHQIELARRDQERDRAELARILTRIDERLDGLEKRR